jgi:putative phosphoesterase
MRIAIVSDPHANFAALQTVLDVMKSADRVVCLGDLTGYYCQPNEVIETLRNLQATCLLGNHDHYVLRGEAPERAPEAVRWGVQFSRDHLNADHRDWLATLAPRLETEWAGFRALLVHGSPWDPLEGYLYADSPRLSELDALDYDLVAFGQTHRAYFRVDRRPLVLNPGSVGQSRDAVAEACAAVLDTASRRIERIRRSYDPRPVLDLAQRHGAGAWITKHLTHAGPAPGSA